MYYLGKDGAGAFSITSAALDIITIINETQPNQDIFLYGLSYGTLWLQRLMLLSPPSNIKGLVLDGVMSHSGQNRSTLSKSDQGRIYDNTSKCTSIYKLEMGKVALKFINLCERQIHHFGFTYTP